MTHRVRTCQRRIYRRGSRSIPARSTGGASATAACINRKDVRERRGADGRRPRTPPRPAEDRPRIARRQAVVALPVWPTCVAVAVWRNHDTCAPKKEQPAAAVATTARHHDRCGASAPASSGDGCRAAPAQPCPPAHPCALPRRTGNRQERRAAGRVGPRRSQPQCPFRAKVSRRSGSSLRPRFPVRREHAAPRRRRTAVRGADSRAASAMFTEREAHAL